MKRSATQAILRSLSAAAGSSRRPCVLWVAAAASATDGPFSAWTARRLQSSWVTPSQRHKSPSGRVTRNGKPVAFHIDDLKNKPKAGASSSSVSNKSWSTSSQVIETPRKYESDLVVVLDMDECLLHSKFMSGPGARYAHQLLQQQQQFQSADGSTVDTFKIYLPDGETAVVHERPHLREFLEMVTSRFETHVYTAAMEVYAKPVLDVLDPHGDMFTSIWYRESCDFNTQLRAYLKNLDNLETSQGAHCPRRTVLVDNNPLSFLPNPDNGILVSSFYTSPEDATLPAVWDMLQDLDDNAADVRPILDSKFGLKQALQHLETTKQSPVSPKATSAPQWPTPSALPQFQQFAFHS